MKKLTNCQICNKKLLLAFKLGKQPLCDDLIKIGSKKKNKLFDINVLFCKECVIAYNEVLVSPKKLFVSIIKTFTSKKTLFCHQVLPDSEQ